MLIFIFLGKFRFEPFGKQRVWNKMNSQITSTAMVSVILFQNFMKLIKLFTWNAWCRNCHRSCKEPFIGDCLIMCCDSKKKNYGRRKGGIGKFISFTLYVIVLFWWSFISKLQSTAVVHIKQCSLDPLWFIMLLFLLYLEIVFHFEPNCCFFDSVANRPPQPCGIITSMAMGWS